MRILILRIQLMNLLNYSKYVDDVDRMWEPPYYFQINCSSAASFVNDYYRFFHNLLDVNINICRTTVYFSFFLYSSKSLSLFSFRNLLPLSSLIARSLSLFLSFCVNFPFKILRANTLITQYCLFRLFGNYRQHSICTIWLAYLSIQ